MFVEHMGWPERNSRLEQVGTFMEGFCIKRADGPMACSADVADRLSHYYGVPRAAIDVIHCGVDADKFRPGPGKNGSNGRPTVLFIGSSIVENKGAHTVVDAVFAQRSKYPDIRLQLLGKGNTDLLTRIQERVRRERAEDTIEYTGFVDLNRIPEFYRSADVFCAPAEYEGFGQVYIEAMACGCPAAVSTAGGGSEAVTDGETGLLVPPNDVGATARALDRILGDTGLRRRMSQAARQRVEVYFAMEKFILRVVAVYEKAIERSIKSPHRLLDERD
jgi:glycosyltransferase involved in cell wall biosynthesis